MNYKAIYDTIVSNSRKRFICVYDSRKSWSKYYRNTFNDYAEVHHIVPRCLGGLDVSSNLCMLTSREHFIVHKLLYKMYPSHKGLFLAYYFMVTQNRTVLSCNSREYATIRNTFSLNHSGVNSHMFGKHNTPESRLKATATRLQNTKAIEASRKFIIAKNKEHSGVNSYNYGKKHPLEGKQKQTITKITKGISKAILYRGTIYLSISIASAITGRLHNNITRTLRDIKDKTSTRYLTMGEYNINDYLWQLDYLKYKP